jgi:hypothetical protein
MSWPGVPIEPVVGAHDFSRLVFSATEAALAESSATECDHGSEGVPELREVGTREISRSIFAL